MFYQTNIEGDSVIATSAEYLQPCLYDQRDIPLTNAVLLDGLLYDNRTIEYWRAYKLDELDEYQQSVMSAGYTTSLGIKSNTDVDSLLWQTMGNILADLNGNAKTVDFVDYSGELKSLSQSDYKKLIKETGNRINDLRKTYTTIKKQINKATTVEQLQAISIVGK